MATIGPHGLQVQYGSFAGKTSPAKQVGAAFPGRLGPHGLVLRAVTADDNVTVILTGARGTGQGGNAAAVLPKNVRQLGPHGLLTPERDFQPKGLFDTDFTLSGASGFGQAEELEGTSMDLTLDGIAGFGLAANLNNLAGNDDDIGGSSEAGITGMTVEEFRRHRKLQALRRHGTHKAPPLKRR